MLLFTSIWSICATSHRAWHLCWFLDHFYCSKLTRSCFDKKLNFIFSRRIRIRSSLTFTSSLHSHSRTTLFYHFQPWWTIATRCRCLKCLFLCGFRLQTASPDNKFLPKNPRPQPAKSNETVFWEHYYRIASSDHSLYVECRGKTWPTWVPWHCEPFVTRCILVKSVAPVGCQRS
jgi:hypothetical protein